MGCINLTAEADVKFKHTKCFRYNVLDIHILRYNYDRVASRVLLLQSIHSRWKKMYLLHNANAHQKKELTINNIQIRFDAFVIKYVGIRF